MNPPPQDGRVSAKPSKMGVYENDDLFVALPLLEHFCGLAPQGALAWGFI
ncbi:MAG: hypothetical protein ACLPID_11315 [Beijerinckiaceae bacterium]